MARNTIVQFTDDLVGTLVEDENLIKMEVPVSFDGHDGTLDLLPTTYEAVRALLLDKDPGGVRTVFSVADTQVVRRTKEELDEIRRLARAAGFDVKDAGRPSKQVEKWYTETYLPSLAQEDGQVITGNSEGEQHEDVTPDDVPAPRKPGKRS